MGQTRGDEKRPLPGLGAKQNVPACPAARPARCLAQRHGDGAGVKFWRFCDSHVLASARVRPFLATAPAPTQPLRPGLPYLSPPRPCGSLSLAATLQKYSLYPLPLFPGFQHPSDPATIKIGSSSATIAKIGVQGPHEAPCAIDVPQTARIWLVLWVLVGTQNDPLRAPGTAHRPRMCRHVICNPFVDVLYPDPLISVH